MQHGMTTERIEQARIEQAMARLNAAMARIDAVRPAETGAVSPAVSGAEHEKLRAEVAETIEDIDALIAELAK